MKRACQNGRRRQQRGFALLMVYVMAASIAITLYMEMPRVAFESQRSKEQLLVDRGNQYKRAIQVFFRKNKRYPTTIDELESFQNVRSLRHRYKDPFTGKEEWRLIHVGVGGVLTDSLIKKPNPLAKDGTTGQTADASQTGATGATGASGQTGASGTVNINGTDGAGLNMALARRASDRVIGGMPGQMNPALADGDPNQMQNPAPPPDPNQYPVQNPQQPLPGLQPGQPYPGQPYPAQPYPGQQVPGQPYPNQPYPVNPGQPGAPVYPTQVVQSQNGIPGQPYSYQPNFPPGANPQFNQFTRPTPAQPAGGLPGFSPGQNNSQQNPAINAIQNALFAPRQPPPGIGSGNTIAAGGIAGVATTYKGASIKSVNDRRKYQEWEFIYDLKTDKSVVGNNGAAQMPQQNDVNPGFGNNPASNSGFGSNPGFGGGSPQPPMPVNRQP